MNDDDNLWKHLQIVPVYTTDAGYRRRQRRTRCPINTPQDEVSHGTWSSEQVFDQDLVTNMHYHLTSVWHFIILVLQQDNSGLSFKLRFCDSVIMLAITEVGFFHTVCVHIYCDRYNKTTQASIHWAGASLSTSYLTARKSHWELRTFSTTAKSNHSSVTRHTQQ